MKTPGNRAWATASCCRTSSPTSAARNWTGCSVETSRQRCWNWSREAGRGPARSGYGYHLVYLFDVRAATLIPFTESRTRVMQDWQRDRYEQVKQQMLEGTEKSLRDILYRRGTVPVKWKNDRLWNDDISPVHRRYLLTSSPPPQCPAGTGPVSAG